MALDDVKVSVAEYPTKPESIPEGQIGFVKSDKSILVNHGNGEVVQYGGKEPVYKGPGTLRKSKLDYGASDGTIAEASFSLDYDGDGLIYFNTLFISPVIGLYNLSDPDGTGTPVKGRHLRTAGAPWANADHTTRMRFPSGVIRGTPTHDYPSTTVLRIGYDQAGHPRNEVLPRETGIGTQRYPSREPSEGYLRYFHRIGGYRPLAPNATRALQFCAPGGAGSGAVVDMVTEKAVHFTQEIQGEPFTDRLNGCLFIGAVPIPNGRFVSVPHDANYVHEFDISAGPSSSSTWGTSKRTALVRNTGATAKTQKFIGGVRLPNGKVLFAPFNHPFIGLYDPETGTYEDGPAHDRGEGAFRGCAILPSGLVVLKPRNKPTLGLYDYVTNKFHLGPSMDVSTYPTDVNKYPCGICTVGNCVWFGARPGNSTQGGTVSNADRHFYIYYPADHPRPGKEPW